MYLQFTRVFDFIAKNPLRSIYKIHLFFFCFKHFFYSTKNYIFFFFLLTLLMLIFTIYCMIISFFFTSNHGMNFIFLEKKKKNYGMALRGLIYSKLPFYTRIIILDCKGLNANKNPTSFSSLSVNRVIQRNKNL